MVKTKQLCATENSIVVGLMKGSGVGDNPIVFVVRSLGVFIWVIKVHTENDICE